MRFLFWLQKIQAVSRIFTDQKEEPDRLLPESNFSRSWISFLQRAMKEEPACNISAFPAFIWWRKVKVVFISLQAKACLKNWMLFVTLTLQLIFPHTILHKHCFHFVLGLIIIIPGEVSVGTKCWWQKKKNHFCKSNFFFWKFQRVKKRKRLIKEVSLKL